MPANSNDDACAPSLPERYRAVANRVAAAARAAGRDPGEVRIMLATKTQPVDVVQAAVAAGADLLGENRVQELVAKAPAVRAAALAGRVRVHLIGPLQTNKINAALAAADCIETLDSPTLARAVSDRCVRDGRRLEAMIQVNVSAEATKSGVAPDGAVALARAVAGLPGLRLTGFMTIGAHSRDAALVRAGFARLRAIRDEVLASGAPGTADARELSMGMTGDLELAIAEGATIVRVGTAVFGSRVVAPG